VRRYNSAALPGETENIFRRWYPDFRPQGQVKKAAHPEPRAIPKEHLEGDSAAHCRTKSVAPIELRIAKSPLLRKIRQHFHHLDFRWDMAGSR
jgi:hypothetical protein